MAVSKPTTGAFVLDPKKADLFFATKVPTSKDMLERAKRHREMAAKNRGKK